MKIGITCYPSFGGSGVVATELGRFLARLGHEIHFISYQLPFRLEREFHENVFFHEVQTMNYPVLRYELYTLSLTVKMAEVIQQADLDILHAHYAVPHSVSAWMSRQILNNRKVKIVTTLHGTDITLVGSAPVFFPLIKHCIERSDTVTCVSKWLRDETKRIFKTRKRLHVIPNFVDTEKFRRDLTPCIRDQLAKPEEKILLHISNFRPVKRIPDVIKIFSLVQKKVPVKLVMVGDGPERGPAFQQVEKLNLTDKVLFLGNQECIEHFLACADVFLFPSEYESFGLAAIEAMSCNIPVISSNGGGLNDLVIDGVNGFKSGVGDVRKMARDTIRILTNEELTKEIGEKARKHVERNFSAPRIASKYETLYYSLLSRPSKRAYRY